MHTPSQISGVLFLRVYSLVKNFYFINNTIPTHANQISRPCQDQHACEDIKPQFCAYANIAKHDSSTLMHDAQKRSWAPFQSDCCPQVPAASGDRHVGSETVPGTFLTVQGRSQHCSWFRSAKQQKVLQFRFSARHSWIFVGFLHLLLRSMCLQKAS